MLIQRGKEMVKNEVQEERMRRYFINAAKGILKGEGLRNISVRNIAKEAGYSYATLYNYFKDVQDLVFECVKDFLTECDEIIKRETDHIPRGYDKIKGITKSYVKYFVQYPGIFELFFIEKARDLSTKQPTIELINSFFDGLCKPEWDFLIEKKKVTIGKAAAVQSQLNFSILGMLLLYINRRHPKTYQEFIELLERQINSSLANG